MANTTVIIQTKDIGRFPEDFMFQLSREEVETVKSQIVTSPDSYFYTGQEGGRRKPPYAFTDAGKKCFGISLLEDPGMVTDLLNRLSTV